MKIRAIVSKLSLVALSPLAVAHPGHDVGDAATHPAFHPVTGDLLPLLLAVGVPALLWWGGQLIVRGTRGGRQTR